MVSGEWLINQLPLNQLLIPCPLRAASVLCLFYTLSSDLDICRPERQMEMREREMELKSREAKMEMDRRMAELELAKRKMELAHQQKAHRHAPGLLLLGIAVVHILCAVWVYQDIRQRAYGSGIWIVIALLAGLLGTLVYAIVRVGDGEKKKA
jgi:hypothetical protein